MRMGMVDNSQRFTAYHYKRENKTKKINYDTDVPIPFKFAWYENKGKITSDEQVLPSRVNPADSAMIETDYELERDHIVVIDGARYSVSKVTPIHNSSHDLRALRGVSNITWIVELDT